MVPGRWARGELGGGEFSRLEEARGLLKKTLALHPECVEAHVASGNLLGGIHCALHDPAAAIAAYQRALALSPGNLEALTAVGELRV